MEIEFLKSEIKKFQMELYDERRAARQASTQQEHEQHEQEANRLHDELVDLQEQLYRELIK